MDSPLDPSGTWKSHFLDLCEWVFLVIFTCELIVKMTAYGVIFYRGSYLRDPWCQLDFVVVSLAWIPILYPNFGNYSVFRAFRALRPLRALKRVPGMPVLVQWILDVMPKMGNVLMLCGLVFLIFGIVGMELFKGSLHYRCALPGFQETPNHANDIDRRRLQGGAEDPQEPWDTGVPCRREREARHCDVGAGQFCAYFDVSLDGGYTSFDTVANAFLHLMQSTT